ncbi:4Fe-4S dicluster domain-containing protein [Heliorestis acidaminivorans]|uniref:4Fe-4S dicluster domain-containing protein n=1 Tax=Heliorestis acidaminivorans TaxID=553427 RepID=A0A6I0F055_9FIRM|nr:4Fe-4S dicluster domain-containing protein [Heliorestis acidaminivorans]KAB2954306.1 4Fe-4S dicluster domain-containing protein [Heliorestis acidaminivorans]
MEIPTSRRKALKACFLTGIGLALATVEGSLPQKIHPRHANASQNREEGLQLSFLFDQNRCTGCKLCARSCKQANNWEKGVEWRKVIQDPSTKGAKMPRDKTLLSISCNHCAKPACASVCPVKAYSKRKEDGIVVQDQGKCVGCKYCLYACPYQALSYGEETKTVSKCHFCYERQDQGEIPICVDKCPTGALQMGELDFLKRRVGTIQQVGNLPNPSIVGKPSIIIVPKRALPK